MRNDAPAPARHIVLVGPMGSGKSTLGRGLAARLGLAFIDVDACIEATAGRGIPAIFASEGEAGFRERESRALTEALLGDAAVIATGGGAILAPANRSAMHAGGTVIYLMVDAATQLARLAGDTGRPLLQGEDRATKLSTLQAIREPLYREVAHHLFDTSTLAAEAAVAALAGLLEASETRRA